MAPFRAITGRIRMRWGVHTYGAQERNSRAKTVLWFGVMPAERVPCTQELAANGRFCDATLQLTHSLSASANTRRTKPVRCTKLNIGMAIALSTAYPEDIQ
jgi:hypothetical protein